MVLVADNGFGYEPEPVGAAMMTGTISTKAGSTCPSRYARRTRSHPNPVPYHILFPNAPPFPPGQTSIRWGSPYQVNISKRRRRRRRGSRRRAHTARVEHVDGHAADGRKRARVGVDVGPSFGN
jgi:hypothetical protein